MGLGSANGARKVSLSDARTKAAACRQELAAGRDPIETRRRGEADAVASSIPTFGEFAERYIASQRPSWRNAKHAQQWVNTLATHAGTLGRIPIDQVGRDEVLAVLRPIWRDKNETASRLRGRIEVILDAAKAEGLRQGENPAGWKGNLKFSLPARHKPQRGHHAAMDYQSVPGFMDALRTRAAVAGRGLEFLILTAARTGEVLGCRWSEIDLVEGVWTVPAERMKAGLEHRVPLSSSASGILEKMAPLQSSPSSLVFPGLRDKALSSMAFEMLLRRMKIENATAHGFRSSFRDWAAEETHFARELAEAALAHVVGDATERAYRRGDALERRRELMEAWASWCGSGGSNEL